MSGVHEQNINFSNSQRKVIFKGTIVSIQPRSSVWRYRLDNRTHSVKGYNVFLNGEVGRPGGSNKL